VATRKKKTARKASAVEPLNAKELRWVCNPMKLGFESTSEVEPISTVVGQDVAVEALRYGLETNAPGQNIFVRGLTGTGRLTLVRRMLQEIRLACPLVKDCVYVRNFQQPDRPRLITLPPPRGSVFKQRIDKLAAFIRNNLADALTSEGIQARRNALEQNAKKQIEDLVNPFEAALREANLRLVSFQSGPVTQTAIFPVFNEEPIPPEQYEQHFAQGKVTEEEFNAFKEHYEGFEKQLGEINTEVTKVRRQLTEVVEELMEKSARWILSEIVRDIEAEFPETSVHEFLDELVEDAITNHLENEDEETDFTHQYRVNVVLEHKPDTACAVIAESSPTMRNLLGTIDYEFGPGDEVRSNHMGIRAGSLLRADGGYLILEVRDVLMEPGAWKVLLRTLRTGKLEIVPPDLTSHRPGPSLKPEPIPLNVKVVLLGDTGTYYLLDMSDPDFSEMFKILADFDTVIPRNAKGVKQYAGVLARIAEEEQLPPFDRTAVAALVEHGARVAAKADRLTTQFGRLADIAREAAFIAGKRGEGRVAGDDIRQAVINGKRRADLPSRRFRELVADGTIRVETRGIRVGQINGLAVLQAGPMIYGFPARITATIGPGTAGVINIEREAALSGAIHTKGFYILSGLLRTLLRTDHPLAFDASVAFEQSYGGIDGDSASGAEICCLLSALTDIPLRQDVAMTGAIDQMGNILAIGAVNEKIEGYFDACNDLGMTGTQSVIIPASNAGDLMLRQDVVNACREGAFHVYAVSTVHDALEVLTGKPAGERNEMGIYPAGSVLGTAVSLAREYWIKASPAPVGGKGASKEQT
jgi:lon-related putative ATP-dependent protease